MLNSKFKGQTFVIIVCLRIAKLKLALFVVANFVTTAKTKVTATEVTATTETTNVTLAGPIITITNSTEKIGKLKR